MCSRTPDRQSQSTIVTRHIRGSTAILSIDTCSNTYPTSFSRWILFDLFGDTILIPIFLIPCAEQRIALQRLRHSIGRFGDQDLSSYCRKFCCQQGLPLAYRRLQVKPKYSIEHIHKTTGDAFVKASPCYQKSLSSAANHSIFNPKQNACNFWPSVATCDS